MSRSSKPGAGPRFRPAVGALVLDQSNRLLIGRRNDSELPHWQLPQGGIREGETPEHALLRELHEEIGTTRVRVLGVLPRRTRYVWRGDGAEAVYDGQSHAWFIVRLEGELESDGASEEFSAFDWIDPADLLDRTHPVRRATYTEVRRMLLRWLSTRGRNPDRGPVRS